jgi:hypothetical protein
MPTPELDPTRRHLLGGGLAMVTAWLVAPHAVFAAAPALRTRNPEVQRTLNAAVSGANWWGGASISKYSDQQYDEIRLKPMQDGGFLTYISGEGRQDFTHAQVIKTVWDHQDKLDRQMDGCVSADRLDQGMDSQLGTEFVDLYMLLDFGLFYGEFFQRMYQYPQADGRTLMVFEKITAGTIESSRWARYQEQRDAIVAKHSDRGTLRGMFGKIIEVSETYGVFIAEPGKRQSQRISMIAKIGFADGGSLIAQMGSKMPLVIKAGLRSGFDASVRIAQQVKAGKYR